MEFVSSEEMIEKDVEDILSNAAVILCLHARKPMADFVWKTVSSESIALINDRFPQLRIIKTVKPSYSGEKSKAEYIVVNKMEYRRVLNACIGRYVSPELLVDTLFSEYEHGMARMVLGTIYGYPEECVRDFARFFDDDIAVEHESYTSPQTGLEVFSIVFHSEIGKIAAQNLISHYRRIEADVRRHRAQEQIRIYHARRMAG